MLQNPWSAAIKHFSHRYRPTGICKRGFSLKKSHIEWIFAGHIRGRTALIWSDPVNRRESGGLSLLFYEDMAGRSRGRFERRWISLIFAGRNRILVIRRELPLTNVASPAVPVVKSIRGFFFVPAPAALSSNWAMLFMDRLLAFSFFGKVWLWFFFRLLSAACLQFPLLLQWPG